MQKPPRGYGLRREHLRWRAGPTNWRYGEFYVSYTYREPFDEYLPCFLGGTRGQQTLGTGGTRLRPSGR